MQLFINNLAAALTAPASASAVQLSVDPSAAALLVGLGSGDHYLLTLAVVDVIGNETAWEIVRVTGKTAGVLDVVRGQEGTTALDLEAGTVISARLTRESMEALQASGGVVVSDDEPQALGVADAGTSHDASRADHVHDLPSPADIGAATSAQGAKADSAVQPGDLSTVATTGAYADLSGKPAIPSVAADVGAIASSEKGTASGVATLDGSSKIPLAQLPATAITDTSVVASQAAMLALTAQTGDLAIRTDISTSFILTAEPASTLGNWQEILAPASGGGAPVGSSTPQALGSATPGVSSSSSRQDHVHAMPTAADVGATPSSHAGAGGTAHADVVAGGASGFMTGAQATKLDGVAAGATANDTDANLKNRANHTGSQLASTISDFAASVRSTLLTGLSLASSAAVAATDTVLEAFGKLQKQITDLTTTVSGKQATLVSGTNIKTVNGASVLGSGDLTVSAAPAPVITESTTSRTLGLTDAGKYIRHTNASASTVTVAPQASVSWASDTDIHIRRAAAGNLTLTPGSGVTLNAPAGGTLVLTNGMSVTLKRVAADVWDVIGQTEAA